MFILVNILSTPGREAALRMGLVESDAICFVLISAANPSSTQKAVTLKSNKVQHSTKETENFSLSSTKN